MFPPYPPSAPLPPIFDDGAGGDSVLIRRVVARTSGAIGGRQFTFSDWSDPVRCAFYGKRADDNHHQMREHMVVKYKIFFDEDPAVGVRDQLFWRETGKLLTVTGVMAAGDPNDSRIWAVFAEEDVD